MLEENETLKRFPFYAWSVKHSFPDEHKGQCL